MREAKTVLVVDDEPDIRKVVGRLLLDRGYEVYTAADGDEALTKAHEWGRIDLILLDVKMPKRDGFEVLACLRKFGFSNVPIVMLTAKYSSYDQAYGYCQGADFYLTKPCEPKRLLQVVDYFIGELPAEDREKVEQQLWKVAR